MTPTPFWSPYEGHQLLDYTECERSIGSFLEFHASQTPNKVALETPTNKLTFEQFNQAANRIAHGLLECAGDNEQRVCLWMPECLEQVYSVAGIWKAGKVLVPVDPASPPAYHKLLVQASDPSVILTNSQFAVAARLVAPAHCHILLVDELYAQGSKQNPLIDFSPERNCTITFTSGSTGMPKGVLLNHRGSIFQTIMYANANGRTAEDVRILLAPLTHVNGPAIILGSIVCGYKLACYPLHQWGVGRLAQWIKEQRITAYSSVPTVFRYFLKTSGPELDLSSVNFVHLGGETVRADDVELFKQYFEDDCILCTNIGSSEGGAFSRYYINKKTVLVNHEVPLGKAYPFKELQLWDEDEQQVAPGEVGEIIVKSRFLSVGYFRNEALTAERYRDVLGEPGVRYFKTGDLGRFREDGCLLFMGRRDQQIKINGHRIEIGEIEACLVNYPNVEQCAIRAFPDSVRGNRLVAYLMASPKQNIDLAQIRHWVAEKLAYYKVPRYWILMSNMPQLASGKLNRNALPEPPKKIEVRDLPETPCEKLIHQLWSKEFETDAIGCEDNFFALGGDSLQMISLANELHERLGKPVSQNLLFSHPTIRELAACLDKEQIDTGNIIPLREGGTGSPLYIVHGWAGSVFHWVDLASMVHLDRPMLGIQGNEFCGRDRHASVDELAEDYASQIINRSGEGPIDLAGYSLGGLFAFAVAGKLAEHGRKPDRIYIIDTQPRNLPRCLHYRMMAPYIAARMKTHAGSFFKCAEMRNLDFIKRRWEALRVRMHTEQQADLDARIDYSGDYYHELSKQYVPKPLSVKVSLLLFRNTQANLKLAWSYLSQNPVDTYYLEGEHMDVLEPEHKESVARVLDRALEVGAS